MLQLVALCCSLFSRKTHFPLLEIRLSAHLFIPRFTTLMFYLTKKKKKLFKNWIKITLNIFFIIGGWFVKFVFLTP